MVATRIKHCGITSMDDAVAAIELGAWAIGLNFWPGSARSCPRGVAEEIGAALRRRAEIAGVFVNQTLDEIAEVADLVPLSMVQLHGDEGASFCAEVARRTGTKVIKAAGIESKADLQALQAFRNVDFHLVDARVPGMRGGTGRVIDWDLIATRYSPVPLILSGGLTPENVGEAIERTAPFAVDVASGTESAPGVKDHELLRAFGEAVAAVEAPV